MKRRAVERWWWGSMTVVAMAASCRDHVPVCGGMECEASLVSMAGAGPREQATAGQAGQAGQAGRGEAAPECSSDADCDNHLICDGKEHCRDGSCEPGDPVGCPNLAMHCEEDASEHCVFDTPSPWLVVGEGDKLAGLPTSELGKQERLVTLAGRPASRGLGFAGAMVGKSGRFALSVALEEEFLMSVRYFRFGPGLPSELQLVPDVPDLLETFREPVVSADSRFALIFDDATGIYLAPLADPRQPTFSFPVELGEYYEASFCEEPGTFWRYGNAGVSIVRATADGPETRQLGGDDTPAFSWEKRFLVLPLSEPAGVLVTTCSIEGVDTVIAAAWGAVIAPGSSALLVNVEDGGQKLFSLEDPEARVELWSSSVPLADAAFSSDGARLVGSVDDVLHVADLRKPDQPATSFGLPVGATFVDAEREENGYQDLVGKLAALVWVPIEGTEDRELFWQPLDLSQERQSLLFKEQSSSLDFFISKNDVDGVFMADHVGEREQVWRLRLDTQEPALEELFTVDTSINRIEVAPDGSGLALLTASSLLQSNLYWAAIDRAGKVQEPVSLSSHAYNFAFQPWP
jgi:hypothetical protein